MEIPRIREIPAVQTVVEYIGAHRRAAIAVTGALALGGGAVALESCGGEHDSVAAGGAAHLVTEASAASQQAANTDCGVRPELGADRANQVYGAPEALFPSLQAGPAGHERLASTETAKARIKEQLAKDSRVLGVFKAFVMETRDRKQLPNAATLDRAQQLIDSYETNKDLAARDAADACEAVEFLEPTNSFAVTRGQAEEVQAHRHNGELTGIDTERVNATENLRGFKVGFNESDASLSPEQRAIFRKLEQLMLITEDGTVVVNELIGPGSIRIAHNKQATPVRIVTKNGQVVHIRPRARGKVPLAAQPNQQQAEQNPGQRHKSGGTTATGHNQGVAKGPRHEKNPGGPHPGPGPAPAPKPEAQPGPDNTPSTGSQPTPGKTPTTPAGGPPAGSPPGESAPPPTSTTPHSETPPPPPPPTTTTPEKGAAPSCKPVPGIVICP